MNLNILIINHTHISFHCLLFGTKYGHFIIMNYTNNYIHLISILILIFYNFDIFIQNRLRQCYMYFSIYFIRHIYIKKRVLKERKNIHTDHKIMLGLLSF